VTGKKLAHYEIGARIGQGGMGEVYRARDTKLGREVAVKVLAEGVAGRDDALARFEQEARAVASLTHPNIVALYELGSAEVDGQPIVYAATELLEGRTLRDHLGEGPAPVRKSIEWTTQICRGLSAAHERGIVHRDIKPENLFVTRDGQVKILDFGLARTSAEVGTADATLRMSKGVDTAPGTVMGTVGYMSPEQVRAQAIEHTSDIFSLGAVLYEMLAGQRAFERGTGAETMTAILREDPPELRQANTSVPPGLDWIVRRCLEKNPHERFQSAHDLGLALQSVSTSSFSAAELPDARTAHAGGARRAWMGGAAIVLAIAAGVAGGRFLFGRGVAETPAPVSVSRLTYDRGRVYAARFAGDGRTIVYSAAVGDRPVEVFMAQIGTRGSRSLDLPPSTSLLSVSRSGELAVLLESRQLAHFLREGTLARAPLAGGSPRPLLDDVMEFDFAPETDEYAVVRRLPNDMIQLEFPAGRTIVETTSWISHPRISPDGRMVAFLRHDLGRFDDTGVLGVSDRDGNVRMLTGSYWSAEGIAWSPAGDEIWFCGGSPTRVLNAADLDGNVRQVAHTFTDLTIRDVDAEGRMLLSEDLTRRGIVLVDLASGEETDRSWLDQSSGAALSRDGRWILFTEEGSQVAGSATTVIRETDGSSLPLVLGAGYAFAISPDALEVIAATDVPPSLVIHPTGAGTSRTLALGVTPSGGAAWTPDNETIVFGGADADQNPRLYAYDGATAAVTPVSPAGIAGDSRYFRLVVAPDSKRVIGVDRTGVVWACALSGDAPVRVEGAEPGETPVEWSADGRWLYVARMRSNRVRIYRAGIDTGARELWREIVPHDPAGMEIYGVMMTPDASTLAYTYKRLTSDLFVVDGWR
jgi:hypothetical protein